jgi:Domain of unknown function (DUF1963)
MWSTKSELEAALRDSQLGDWAPRLAELARDCIIFVPGPIEEGAAAPIGASRLGGEPDLPPNVDWPTRPPINAEPRYAGPVPGSVLLGPRHWLHRLFRTQDWRRVSQQWERAREAEKDRRNRAWPLSFVAQIDFAELHAARSLDGFPPAGRLLLFCDGVDFPWGAREEQVHARVVFTELPADRLQRRRHPQEFDEAGDDPMFRDQFVFKPRILRPTAWLLPPPLGVAEQRVWASPKWPAWPAYQQFWRDLYTRHPETFGRDGERIHQVGGVAFSIQQPVEAECAKFADDNARPRRWWHSDVYMCAPTKEHLARAVEWQLVLQIDSDDKAGIQWGDAGRLYLCAHRQDVAARRFDRCWMVAQCY